MGLQKGKTNNRNGRPKGTPNKVTGELREALGAVLTKEMTPAKLSQPVKKARASTAFKCAC